MSDTGNRRWVMDVAWTRDKNGQVYTGESLVLACLMKVKKSKNRTAADEAELQRILSKKRK